MQIEIRETRALPRDQVIDIYRRNHWSSVDKPEQLYQALTHSHTVLSAWVAEDTLVGLANAISDGYLVVYYPHLIVHPDFHKEGVGRLLMVRMRETYAGYHQQMVTADGDTVDFYKKCGFERAGRTVPMWIYQGDDH